MCMCVWAYYIASQAATVRDKQKHSSTALSFISSNLFIAFLTLQFLWINYMHFNPGIESDIFLPLIGLWGE